MLIFFTVFKPCKTDSDKAVLSSSIEPIPETEQCRYIEVDAISIKLGNGCVSDTSKTHLALSRRFGSEVKILILATHFSATIVGKLVYNILL